MMLEQVVFSIIFIAIVIRFVIKDSKKTKLIHMGRKTPPFINCPEMTTSAFWTPIRSDLRKRWLYFPEHKKAIINARVGKLRNNKTNRLVLHLECSECHELLIESEKKFEVDHLEDVGSLKCFDDLSGFAERLFCKAEGLRVVCKECHQVKTNKNR